MKKIFYRIKKFAKVVIDIQVRVILSIAYFVIITPIALFARVFSDPLEIKRSSVSYWKTHKKIVDISEFLTRQ